MRTTEVAALLASMVFLTGTAAAQSAAESHDEWEGSYLHLAPQADDRLFPTGTDEAEPGEAAVLPRRHGDDWEFTLAPYLWMMSFRATVEAGPASTTTEACFSDLLSDLDLGGSLRLEGLRGKWGFFVDGSYLRLSDESTARIRPFRLRGVDVEADFTQAWVDFGGIRRFGEPGRSFDLMLGGRYAHVEVDVSVGPFIDLSESSDNVSPLVGGRWNWALSDRWALAIKGDVGGFGVGAADLMWGVTGLLGFHLSESTTLGIGYRYYDIDFGDGDIDLDLAFHGPVVGLAFRF